MQTIANKWAGKLYGTNTGNLFMVLTHDEETVSGTARFLDDLYGLALYDVTGTFDEKLILNCTPLDSNVTVDLGDVKVTAVLTPEGNLRGDWISTVGTAGTLVAYPHDVPATIQNSLKSEYIPEQIYNKNISIGSVRLFSDDVVKIISYLEQDYDVGRAIVTYNNRGSQVTKYANDFVRDFENLSEINYLKITIQEAEVHGINKVIVLELVDNDTSEVRVSGVNEAWVLGKAQSIAQELKPKQNVLVTTYKKYGLNLNGFIFFTMLVAIPGISDWINRGIFVVTVFLLLNILLFIHGKFIPNTKIYLSKIKPSLFTRTWPSILSWAIAASSSIFAAWIFYLLTKNGNP